MIFDRITPGYHGVLCEIYASRALRRNLSHKWLRKACHRCSLSSTETIRQLVKDGWLLRDDTKYFYGKAIVFKTYEQWRLSGRIVLEGEMSYCKSSPQFGTPSYRLFACFQTGEI